MLQAKVFTGLNEAEINAWLKTVQFEVQSVTAFEHAGAPGFLFLYQEPEPVEPTGGRAAFTRR